ncbi:MAG: hypothetical protein COA78_03810 [Blastopirellula sp.]|nr:MAG: hypothetical protein COA78_03810 [Blastopirellula sp.]
MQRSLKIYQEPTENKSDTNPPVESAPSLTPVKQKMPIDNSEQIQVPLDKLLHLATNSSEQAELIAEQEVTVSSDLYRALLAHNNLFDPRSLPEPHQSSPTTLRG